MLARTSLFLGAALLLGRPASAQQPWQWDLSAGYARSYRISGFEVEAGGIHQVGREVSSPHRLGFSVGYFQSDLDRGPEPSFDRRRMFSALGRYELHRAARGRVDPHLFVGAGLVYHVTSNPLVLQGFRCGAPEYCFDRGSFGPIAEVGTGLAWRVSGPVAGLARLAATYHPVIPGAGTSLGWRLLLGVRVDDAVRRSPGTN